MPDQIRLSFELHVRSVVCVSADEAARLGAGGLRVGPNDQQMPVEVALHTTPAFDRVARQARRAYAAGKARAARGAQAGRALATAEYLPRDIPPGQAAPGRALYQNVRPPRGG